MIVGLALVGAWVGCGADDGATTGPARSSSAVPGSRVGSHGSPEDVPVVERVGHRERRHFALLRGKPEPLPLLVRQLLRRPEFGMNWALAQRLRLAMRRSFWLVPGRHVLCLVHTRNTREAATACTPTDLALKDGVVAVSLQDAGAVAPAKRLVVGVVPDGTREVIVHTHTVASKVRIENHLFVLKDSISQPPDIVSLN